MRPTDTQGGQKHDKSTLTIEADKPAVSDAELDAQSQLKLRTRRHYSLQADDYVTLLLRAARCAEASSGGGAVVVGPTVAVRPHGVATGADTTGVARVVPRARLGAIPPNGTCAAHMQSPHG